ncbi:cell division FtsA domain-containing protein [Caloramator proteoclasticus]|uniref:Cell division protein FtsA n=1 Tax=Caloramator proteoclasticus DSM 10124 TaxID=1121262 RepID=A0A1M4ZXV1_9CLOT|nr:cell division FtsA domain-containing protein [Caloramator proteoclasticus]SHF22677.1 cell division protein FtsA [Caloramator proteoclasticus DSM 10124]
MENIKFALDIGTRTVIGIAFTLDEDKIKIVDEEIIEHKKRAMMDGQVHDIQAVSEVAYEVKTRLEERLCTKFDRVSIAAAGRILKTTKVLADLPLKDGQVIDRDFINNLELEALSKAYSQINTEDLEEKFYCVGYSVINYFLNDYLMTNLEGHRGKKASVELLATFLPQSVVDSLYSVIKNIGLEVETMTLEPIAAMNAVIPKEYRLLNLALIDIGAGTSDIAITKDGTVVAYGMVPFAGDEITEAICHHLVVDFNTAEEIKLSLNTNKKTYKYTDILLNTKTVKLSEIKKVIEPTVEKLAELICQKIIELNGKSPNAVFLVGGGSQVVKLPEFISSRLGIPKDRVAVRGIDAIKNVIYSGNKLNGPDCVTPIGIAINSINSPGSFIVVKVNGKEVKLYNSGKQRVSNALHIAGIKPQNLFAKSGKGINIKINGQERRFLGEAAKPSMIFKNGQVTSLLDCIEDGDEIVVNFAVDGRDAEVLLKDVLKEGQMAKVNGVEMGLDYKLSDGDEVEIIELKFNEVKEEDFIYVVVNGEPIKLQNRQEGYIFVDIFNYVDIDINSAKAVRLLLNDRDASFTDRIKDGDRIIIETHQ